MLLKLFKVKKQRLIARINMFRYLLYLPLQSKALFIQFMVKKLIDHDCDLLVKTRISISLELIKPICVDFNTFIRKSIAHLKPADQQISG